MSAVARTRRTAKSDVATASQHTCLSRRDTHEPFHRGPVSTPNARRLRGGRGPRSGAQCFHRRLGDASILRPLAADLEHQSASFVLPAAEGGAGVQRQRAEEGSVGSAERYGQPARADKLAGTEWTTDRTGLPLLREALAWFECELINEHPAGDHVLVLGKVIGGKLLDSEVEPMSYRETGSMDGASKLFPDAFSD